MPADAPPEDLDRAVDELYAAERPEGLWYEEGFVTEEEEGALLSVFEGMEFSEVRMRGQAAKRTVVHYGYRYDYESWGVTPADPLPASLTWLRDRAARLIGVDAGDIAETLVTRYPAGAGIGWHRDATVFGPQVVGVSLGSACVLRFQRRTAGGRRVYSLEVAPRSVYVLRGAARTTWQHSITATKTLRYSVTFRTLRRPPAPGPEREGGG